ncbi:response regulator transcription factor [Segetibacter sp. 3557_3]|uniref:response regulator transcription factor n=1 Tax=Segetibacter sp. 3557_3 TaxID=2547429 RepID=UPI001058D379|nr:response regulator transcription factor [Segetibacter sp. 3557_3]TDH18281.1 response regulator transcription factor [Segetibacter sp. 3557_3]
MQTHHNGRIKVLITDDHALFRTGVKTSLAHYPDIEFLGEAENGMELLSLLTFLHPDVILLDIQMPVMDGIATLPEVKKLLPDVKIIMLTMHDEISMISKLMEIGANSYLIKNSDSETIHEAILSVYSNEFFFNEYTNKAMLNGLRSRRLHEVPHLEETELSEKETLVLKLMCEEKSTREIAEIVDISPRTVEAIRDRLKVKTGSKSTAGLILYAVKKGILHA